MAAANALSKRLTSSVEGEQRGVGISQILDQDRIVAAITLQPRILKALCKTISRRFGMAAREE